MNMATFTPFQAQEHRPFLWQGGSAAALLVHGFPGTPAEMRGLGQALHNAGWTVDGLLLPGFGADVTRMLEYGAEDWIAATVDHLRSLRRNHDRVVLIGYSMGAAVSINAATQEGPDQLVLIAPFWQLGNGWQNLFWPALRLFFRTFKPFKRADFSDPNVRAGIRNFMPDVDLDDPAVQESLRTMEIPSSLVDGLRLVGRMAFANAPHIQSQGIVVQGTHDEVVDVTNTRRLVKRLGSGFDYHEIEADHRLIAQLNPGFLPLQQHVLDYLGSDIHSSD